MVRAPLRSFAEIFASAFTISFADAAGESSGSCVPGGSGDCCPSAANELASSSHVNSKVESFCKLHRHFSRRLTSHGENLCQPVPCVGLGALRNLLRRTGR